MLPLDPSRDALLRPELGDTLFAEGQAYSAEQVALECMRLAYVRAEQSPAGLARLTAALGKAGFAAPEMLDGSLFTGSEGFAAMRGDGLAVIAFRGTQPDKAADLGTNINILPVPWPHLPGLVHFGFANAFDSLRQKVADWVNAQRPRELVVCGHSLGGALATIAAKLIHPDLLVTAGCPRVGNEKFAFAPGAKREMRLVNCSDIVPQLPPPVFGYRHGEGLVYITHDGRRIESPAESVIEQDQATGRAQYLADFAWQQGAVSVRDLADHSPVNYARSFF